MERPDPEAAGLTRPVRVVLLVGLLSAFALVTVGVVAGLAGARVSYTCPVPADMLRCLRSGDFCAAIALGLLILLITPPAAAVALATGFVRTRHGRWAALSVAVVALTALAVVVGLK